MVWCNYGAGDKAPLFPSPPWWNIDVEDGPNIQEIIDLREDIGSVTQDIECAFLSHTLEHFPYLEAQHLLTLIRKAMTPKAPIVVVGPDVAKAAIEYKAGRIPLALYQATQRHGEVPARGQGHLGGCHAWNSTANKVISLLTSSGFSDVKEITFEKLGQAGLPVVNPSAWQLVCVARA